MAKCASIPLVVLESMVQHFRNQTEHHNMHSFVNITIERQGGREHVCFEQPCHYAECNSNYRRFDYTEQ